MFISEPFNHCVLQKDISVPRTLARPPTFNLIDSTPLIPAVCALAIPELRAHGLMSSSVAPPWPVFCSLPAIRLVVSREQTAIDPKSFFILFAVRVSIKMFLGQEVALLQTI